MSGRRQRNQESSGACLFRRLAPLPIYRTTARRKDMATTIDKADAYSRPNARFDEDGQLEIRASAAGGCRRALWYTATGHQPSTTPTEDSLTILEAGNALEPVVLRGDGAGRLGGHSRRHSRPEAGFGAARPEPEGDGPPRRNWGHAPVRRRGGHRGQDQGAWGLQALANDGGGAKPSRLGGAGRRLHLRDLWRGPRRGDRHDGHGEPRLGLRGDTRRPGGAGSGNRPGPGSASLPSTMPCTERTPTSCRSGTSPWEAGGAAAAPS